jgi:UDP-glucose 4-epimerase
VLEVIEAFGPACGHAIPDVITQRRSADAAITVADNSEVKQQLGWQTKRNLDDMFQDGWRWQQANPHGYASVEAA